MTPPPKELVKEMHRPTWFSLWLWLILLVSFFAGEGLLAWAMVAGNTWLAVLLVVVLAHLMHCHLIAFHEAAHESLCPVRWCNEAAGIFVGVFGLMSLSLFRAVHYYHHAYLATERDEEFWPLVLPSIPRWQRRLAATLELTLGLFYTPWLFLRAFLHQRSTIQNPHVRRRIWAELSLVGGFWSVALAAVAWWHAWTYLAVMYLAPAMLAGNLQSWRKYIEHVGMHGATVLGVTRSVVPKTALGRFLAFTLFNEPYHGIHHKFAQMPQAAVPVFTPLLQPQREEESRPFATYRAACIDMIGSLVDPSVGAQWLTQTVRREDTPRADIWRRVWPSLLKVRR